MHNPAHRMVMSLHFCNFMNGILQMPIIFFLWLLRRNDPHLSTSFDHSRKSTVIVLLFLRVFLLDSTMSSQIAARDSGRSCTRPTKDTESDGNHPLSGAIKPLVEKGIHAIDGPIM